MIWNIEFYKENDWFCAFISDNKGGSGITIKRTTRKELGDEISLYVQDLDDDLEDYVRDLDDETEDSDE